MRQSLPLNLAAQFARVDPSWLQFIGREFREFLTQAPGDCVTDGFDPADLPLIESIHQRLVNGGETPDAVRQDLWRRGRRLRIIAVTSGKGGVGKTTVSVNLAVAFSQLGLRVLLVDADLGMANVHVYAGIQPRATVIDLLDGTRPLAEAVTVGPGGIHILCGQSGIARAADLDPRSIEFLETELRRSASDYDLVLIDTGAGISAQVMSFLAMADDIIVIATPNLASTLDAYGLVKVARERELAGRIHILVNEADEAAQAGNVFGRVEACAQRFLQFTPSSLGFLPRDAAFEAANQNRKPIVLAAPEQEAARRFSALARQLIETAPAAGQAPPKHPAAA